MAMLHTGTLTTQQTRPLLDVTLGKLSRLTNISNPMCYMHITLLHRRQ
jgi:hypothetical protein